MSARRATIDASGSGRQIIALPTLSAAQRFARRGERYSRDEARCARLENSASGHALSCDRLGLQYTMTAGLAGSGFFRHLLLACDRLERQLDAARCIGRHVAGDPGTRAMVDIGRLRNRGQQSVAVAGAPLGTRGGLVTARHVALIAGQRKTRPSEPSSMRGVRERGTGSPLCLVPHDPPAQMHSAGEADAV
jgi:hypothetical protein